MKRDRTTLEAITLLSKDVDGNYLDPNVEMQNLFRGYHDCYPKLLVEIVWTLVKRRRTRLETITVVVQTRRQTWFGHQLRDAKPV